MQNAVPGFEHDESRSQRLSFLSGFVLDGLPGWRETMHLPVPERLRALADPDVRRRLNEGAHSEEAGILRDLANWERLSIVETFAPENADATGRTSAKSQPLVGKNRSTRCSTSSSPTSCARDSRRGRPATTKPTGRRVRRCGATGMR